MVRHGSLLVAFHVVSDALLAAWAFLLAYVIRFDFGLIPIRKGIPPLAEYLNVLPLIGLLTPLVFHFRGVYRLRRGRSRIDDFFAVLVGSIVVVVLEDARDVMLSGVSRASPKNAPAAPAISRSSGASSSD